MSKQSTTMLLFVMYGSAFLAGFNENLMNMGLMGIMADYSIDSITAQWLVTGYMIVATVMVTAMAFLYRRFNLRTLFFVGAAFSIAGSGLGLFSSSFIMLMAARLVQALGMGMFIPMMMNTILATVPKNKLGTFMAVGGCMISFGPAFAPVVCGALVTALGWHSIFAAPLAGMVVLTALGTVFVRNLGTSEAHLDALSLLLSAVFLFTLSFGLAQLSVNAVWGGASLAAAVVCGALFVLRQGKTEYPLIDMRPMVRKTFWPAALLVFIAMLVTFSLSVLLPLYFEGAMGMSAMLAGFIILVPVLVNCGTTLLGGKIMDKKGEWPLLPAGFLLITLGAGAMIFASTGMSVVAMLAVALVVYIGIGLVFSPSQTAGLRTLPPHESPFGVALMTTFTQIAACVGPSLFIGVMSGSQAGALAQGTTEAVASALGFSSAILVATAFCALGLAIAFVFSTRLLDHGSAIKAERRVESAGPLSSVDLAAVMDIAPYMFPADMPVFAAMREMVSRGINGAPLAGADGKLAGYLSDGDVMRYLAKQHPAFTTSYSFIQAANNQTLDERMKELMDLPCSVICTDSAITLSASASFEDACDLLANHKLEQVPVVDESERVVGCVDRSKLMRAAMRIYLDGKDLAA